MIDYNELRRKFQPKKPLKGRPSNKAVVKAIAREYELKKAELTGGAPVIRKGFVFYGVVIIGLMMLGGMVLSVCGKGGRAAIPLKPLQAQKSMRALTLALGRYKFHVGEYPSTEEGLAVLAYRRPNEIRKVRQQHKGWDGPYVNHVVPDPWGNDYVYETRPEGGNPVLYSKGPDGRAGTTDDVLPEQTEFDRPFRDTTWTNRWAPCELRGVVVAPDEETKRRVQDEMRQYDRKD